MKLINSGCIEIDSDQISIVRVIKPILCTVQNYFNYISFTDLKSTNILEFSRTRKFGNVGICVVSRENKLEIESI